MLDTEDVEVISGKHGGKGAARMKGATFTAQSFSVYAIVDAPEPVSINPQNVQTLNEFTENYDDSDGFYLSRDGNRYFTNTVIVSGKKSV